MKSTKNKTIFGVIFLVIVIVIISTIPLWIQQQKTHNAKPAKITGSKELHRTIDALTETVKANNADDMRRLTAINDELKENNASLTKIAAIISLSAIDYTLFACKLDLNQASQSDSAYKDLYVIFDNNTHELPNNSEYQPPKLLEKVLMKKLTEVISAHETLLKKIDGNFINNPLYAKITSRRTILSTVNGNLQNMKDSFVVIATNQTKLENIVKTM